MKKILSLAVLILTMLCASTYAAHIATTIAGGGTNPPAVGLTATDVEIGEIYSSKVDNNGNLYIANYPKTTSNLWVIRVDKWGKVDRLYENSTTPIWYFDDIVTDSAGNIYLPAYDENVVYKVTPDGTTTVFAGNGTYGFSGDGGPATSAQLESPESVTVDQNDNVYVSHYGSNRVIRKIDKQGIISSVFDGTGQGYGMFNTIFSDGLGTVYFSEGANLWKVTGINSAVQLASAEGNMYGIAGDKYGNLFYSYDHYDSGIGALQQIVKKIDAFGVVSTVIQNSSASWIVPTRLSTDKDGTLYVNYYNYPSGSSVEKVIFAPELGAITPLDAAVGERVILSGRYFGSNGIGGTVTFGGISAPIHSWSNDMIVCDIPAGSSKTVDVVVTAADGQASNLFSYRIR